MVPPWQAQPLGEDALWALCEPLPSLIGHPLGTQAYMGSSSEFLGLPSPSLEVVPKSYVESEK